MDVRAKQQTICYVVLTALVVRPDMSGIKDGERSFACNRAPMPVNARDAYSERALSKPWSDQNWVRIAGRRDRWVVSNDRSTHDRFP
jgi:hypothetical protein